MKIALKYWLKDGKAFAVYLGTMVIDIIGIILNTMFIQYLPKIFDPAATRETFIIFAITLVGQIFTEIIMGYGYRSAKMHMNASMNKMYGDKIGSVNYDLFTKTSCSKIWTIGEFMWSAARVMDCIKEIVTLAFSIIAIFIAIGYNAGWAILVPIVILYAIFLLVMKLIYKRFNVIEEKRKKLASARNQEMHNIIDGFEILRIFNNKTKHLNTLDNACDDVYSNQLRKSKINSTMRGIIAGTESIAIALVAIYSIWQIKEGNITSAVAVSLIMYITKIMKPLTSILSSIDDLSDTLMYSKDFEDIMNSECPDENERKITLSEFNDKITIKNVGFSYSDSANVLNNISMEIKKGQKIGIVGRSGGGKSTIGKLLMRFYTPSNGSIEIDGININMLTNESFSNFVACVPQDTMILPGTIRENILYAKPSALESEMVEATKNANLYNFIMSLPNGFNTEVGPRGLQLSGGQKQRIALARVFLKNPDIILLDEATSALDNESETLVQEAIDRLSNDKTIITIAHRLSTIKNSDCIYVLDNHKIAEHGTHDELVKLNGIYASMIK